MEDEDFKEKVLDCMKRNTEAIEKLTKDTKGLVEAWNASTGAIKVAKVAGKFMMWLTAIGTPVFAFIYWVKTGNIK